MRIAAVSTAIVYFLGIFLANVVAAGVALEKRDSGVMGEGGLCLGCKPCAFPLCPFGK